LAYGFRARPDGYMAAETNTVDPSTPTDGIEDDVSYVRRLR
jgi:hypothetical protein